MLPSTMGSPGAGGRPRLLLRASLAPQAGSVPARTRRSLGQPRWPSGFGPERVRGRPRSHSPGERRPRLPGPRECAPGRGYWGSPRSPGSSCGLGEHRPGGAERGRAAAGRRRPSHSDPVPRLRPPHPPARRLRPASLEFGSGPRGRAGPRALKGAALFPGWLGGRREELESPDWGGGGTRAPGPPHQPGRPVPAQPSPYRTLQNCLVSFGEVWAILTALHPWIAASSGGPHGLFPRRTQEAIGTGAAKSPPPGRNHPS